ncbi:MAG: hypothetical protein LBF27_21610 [Sphingobacterium sp.]|jgi:lauroyl/myristoyl acyltransferase|nr:hypothetical protein [Sphingobacterium sp.]
MKQDVEQRYQLKKAAIREIVAQEMEQISTAQINSYSYFSANLKHFMPMLDWDMHCTMYRQYQEQLGFNALDAQFMAEPFPIPIRGWEELRLRLSQDPGIVCTFHFGAYQLLNYLLLRDGLRFALLVAADVVSTWEQRYPNLIEQLREGEAEGRFCLLNADEKTALRRIYSLVGAGYLLVIYVDGLSGIRPPHDKNLVEIPFLGQRIWVPAGAATLGYQLQCPLYPVLALRKEEEVVLLQQDAIRPHRQMAKAEFVQMSTGKLFGLLATFLMHAPQQWTIWTQVDRFLNPQSDLIYVDIPSKAVQQQINLKQYALIRQNQGSEKYYFLMDKGSYQLYALEHNEYERLFEEWYR